MLVLDSPPEGSFIFLGCVLDAGGAAIADTDSPFLFHSSPLAVTLALHTEATSLPPPFWHDMSGCIACVVLAVLPECWTVGMS